MSEALTYFSVYDFRHRNSTTNSPEKGITFIYNKVIYSERCVRVCVRVCVCVPAPGLVDFGLDQHGSVAPHRRQGQDGHQGQRDQQDGQTRPHQPGSRHADVAALTHEPEVISRETAVYTRTHARTRTSTHTHNFLVLCVETSQTDKYVCVDVLWECGLWLNG